MYIEKHLSNIKKHLDYQLPSSTSNSFYDLVMVFLNHFHLLVWYDVNINIFSTLRKDKSTHIFDHTQQWQ